MTTYTHEILYSDDPRTLLEVMDKFSVDGWEPVNVFTYPSPLKNGITRLNILIRKMTDANPR